MMRVELLEAIKWPRRDVCSKKDFTSWDCNVMEI